MPRPRVITVRAEKREEFEAAARRTVLALTQQRGCERLLVVYGPQAARMYVEGATLPPPRTQAVPGEARACRESRDAREIGR